MEDADETYHHCLHNCVACMGMWNGKYKGSKGGNIIHKGSVGIMF